MKSMLATFGLILSATSFASSQILELSVPSQVEINCIIPDHGGTCDLLSGEALFNAPSDYDQITNAYLVNKTTGAVLNIGHYMTNYNFHLVHVDDRNAHLCTQSSNCLLIQSGDNELELQALVHGATTTLKKKIQVSTKVMY